MARRTLPLNDLSIKKSIKTAKTENKTAKCFDGGGLFLLIDKSGNTGWRFKYRISLKSSNGSPAFKIKRCISTR